MTPTTYERWAAGLCPCCARKLADSENGTPCRAIGEGVLICGHCSEERHCGDSGLGPALLTAILEHDDRAVDEWERAGWAVMRFTRETR